MAHHSAPRALIFSSESELVDRSNYVTGEAAAECGLRRTLLLQFTRIPPIVFSARTAVPTSNFSAIEADVANSCLGIGATRKSRFTRLPKVLGYEIIYSRFELENGQTMEKQFDSSTSTYELFAYARPLSTFRMSACTPPDLIFESGCDSVICDLQFAPGNREYLVSER